MINRRELVSALIDEVSTPRDCAFDDTVREMVNKRLRATSQLRERRSQRARQRGHPRPARREAEDCVT